MKKILGVMVVCLGLGLFGASSAQAAAINLVDGDVIKTAENPNVYIVKQGTKTSYKRLILSPDVFRSYGHLKWKNIKIVPQDQMDSYLTVTTVRVDGEQTVYSLMGEIDGDGGMKAKLDVSDIFDWDCIYTVNRTDMSSYRLTTHEYYLQDQNRQEALDRIGHAETILMHDSEYYFGLSQNASLSEQERAAALSKGEELRTTRNNMVPVYIKISDGNTISEDDVKMLQAQAFFTNTLDPYSGLGFLFLY